MLRYADRTTILLCVCPSGQKKVRKPFAGVDVISLWVGRELALVCNSSGWRMVGEKTHGRWGDPMVGAAPGDARSTPAAAPTLVWTSHHPYTHLTIPLPACPCQSMCSFLFTFSTVSPLAWSFTCPNCPNYLVASHLIFHLGILNSDPRLILRSFFLQKAFQHKINFLKFKQTIFSHYL